MAKISFKNELIEIYGGIAFEKQLFFANIVGEMEWNVDINKGEISFDNNLTFPIQILGTFSHSSESWLWAWANTASNIPKKISEQAQQLKKYGQKYNIEFLTNGQFEIERTDMHYIGLIAVGLFRSSGYYLGNYGAGTMCMTVSSNDMDRKIKNNHHSILTVFPQLISQFEINHKEAFKNYLKQKQYKINENENKIIGSKDKEKVIADFDDLNRLINLSNG
jgi:hypothetical protein